jgi:uncharacterized protein (TIGR02271 family)
VTDHELAPTEATIERAENGWSIRLPLRREELRAEKRTVVAERLLIRRKEVADVAHLEATVRREELRVSGSETPVHDLDVTQPLDTTTRLPR